jgi:hypothetical protein
VQPEQGGQLVNDLIGRILYIQPEGLARLNELPYQRQGGIPDNLAGMINPAPHGRLPDSFTAYRVAWAAEASSPGSDDPGHHRANSEHDQ